ncbi:M4 family metallopeptidase [Winogradskya humida]|uniref:Bacillolysin n=1 Tax=Winogradskya humida TaxID=113566 RepID=A0ABQ3ZZE0_9ACTN|nr:M4 family metallopeptidase [Actinoplanes humidus]GIE23467.1 bacillolysin [Actinoplanes humidus]
MASRLGRRLLAIGAVAGMTVVAGATAANAAPAPDGLTLIATRQSLLGTHNWYQQTYRGLPVVGGFYATHLDSRTGKTEIQDGRITIKGTPAAAASYARSRAESTVTGRLAGTLMRSSEAVIEPGTTARLGWRTLTRTGHGTVETITDAVSGTTLTERNTVKEVSGSGQVFSPNPVATLQNESLTDSSNANSTALAAAYKTVTLTQLTSGVTTLKGAYANNTSSSAVTSSTRTYTYNRSQAGFEQVMAYYHLTTAQEYIQSLGFTDVNNSAQTYRTTGYTADNSYYDPSADSLTFGTGGVDDAEDAEVIWHEYGHAIQDDQVPGFGSSAQSGAIGEAFGDYWAYTMSSAVSANTTVTPLACIADWDAVSYTSTTPHCLRRVDGTKVYPGDWENEVHADGEIWSRALFDIHNALGRTQANSIILEAQFSYAPGTTFAAAANTTVTTAQTLYGTAAATAVRTAFQARGII